MKNPRNIWLMGLGLLLTAALLAPAPGLAKEEGTGHHWAVEREKLAQDLKMSPENTKEFLAVGEKFDRSRKEIFDSLKKNEDELGKVLAQPKPDEAKVKELVTAVTADFDRLMASFKAQRQEEMAQLTTLEQGRFLLALKKWHEEMREKYTKKEEKQEEKK